MKGFSLLELSIAIAIMALLMAGVSVGGSILESAQVLSVAKRVKEVDLAVFNFKEKYGSYPGDFSDAYRYFAYDSDDICGEESQCNGDDDGYIEVGEKYSSETYRLWQHLELAGVIKGSYSGVWGVDQYYMESDFDSILTVKQEEDYGNVIKLGSFVSVSGGTSDGGAFLPLIAERIDQKLDDSSPVKGQLRGGHGFLGGDESDDGNYDQNCHDETNYKVAYEESSSCNIFFILY